MQRVIWDLNIANGLWKLFLHPFSPTFSTKAQVDGNARLPPVLSHAKLPSPALIIRRFVKTLKEHLKTSQRCRRLDAAGASPASYFPVKDAWGVMNLQTPQEQPSLWKHQDTVFSIASESKIELEIHVINIPCHHTELFNEFVYTQKNPANINSY